MKPQLIALLLTVSATHIATAHPISSKSVDDIPATFDIIRAAATHDGRLTTFTMDMVGSAGTIKPVPIGKLEGAKVTAYVWPTSFDPSVVGFDEGSGILSLAITAHPDFDDTPLYDEDQDGDPTNDGADWHSHWVVLVEDEACGAGLKVRDVSLGVDLLPNTAPYLPIAMDSPGMSPSMSGNRAQIVVPIFDPDGFHFDGVTAELQVNDNAEAPLLCVQNVYDIASGDLSLPGRVTPHD